MARTNLKTYSSLWNTIIRIWIAYSPAWKAIHLRRSMWSRSCITCFALLTSCTRPTWCTVTSSRRIFYWRTSAMLSCVILASHVTCHSLKSNSRRDSNQKFKTYHRSKVPRPHRPNLRNHLPSLRKIKFNKLTTIVAAQAASIRDACHSKKCISVAWLFKKRRQSNQRGQTNRSCHSDCLATRLAHLPGKFKHVYIVRQRSFWHVETTMPR